MNAECWEWRGARSGAGYGQKRINDRALLTHRLAYAWANGPIPDGLHVLHRCDNPPCCNPDHLFLGTNNDNIADSMAKGRRKGIPRPSKFKGIKRGPKSMLVREFSYKHKTPYESRVLMRRERRRGWSFRRIAALHGVSFKVAYKECSSC